MKEPIKILHENIHEYIRLHPEMYLPANGNSIQEKLAWLLFEDCLVLGAKDVNVIRKSEWWLVSSSFNWLNNGRRDVKDITELFTNVMAMPEAGQNSIRHEVIVAAFSSDLLICIEGNCSVIHSAGQFSEIEIGKELCASTVTSSCAIAFRCEALD